MLQGIILLGVSLGLLLGLLYAGAWSSPLPATRLLMLLVMLAGLTGFVSAVIHYRRARRREG